MWYCFYYQYNLKVGTEYFTCELYPNYTFYNLFYVDINTSHTMATILCQRALHFIIGLFTNSIRLGAHQKSVLLEANVLSQFVWTILHTCSFGVWYYFCQAVESPELFWRSNKCDTEINVAIVCWKF